MSEFIFGAVDETASLLEKGVPEEIIAAKGSQLCKHCYGHLMRVAPEEVNNYHRLGWWQDLLGSRCKGCPEPTGL